MYSLHGRAAVVTGGGSGIGRAVALRLAREGCGVGVVDLDGEAAREVASAIETLGVRSGWQEADVSDQAGVARAVDELAGRLGQLDILFNGAGILRIAKVADMSRQDWSDTFRINVDGTFFATRAALPHLAARPEGRIINMASWLGKSGKAAYGAYSASKYAIIGLTESLALELAPKITVNAICPGIIANTRMRERAEADLRALGMDSAATRTAGIPLGRLGEPEDVANLAAFLASCQSSYMTGQAITLAGGMWRS